MQDAALTAEEAAEQQETDWAVQEFGAAHLGDARRTARLVALACQLSLRPQAALPEACGDVNHRAELHTIVTKSPAMMHR